MILVRHEAEAFRRAGAALRDAGALDQAIASYRQALQVRPEFFEALIDLGIALATRRESEEALSCFRRALGIQPGNPSACNNLGYLLRDLGRLDEAEEILRLGLQSGADVPEIYNNLGAALAQKDRLDEAAACYRHALRLRPDYPEAINNMGVASLELGRFQEAGDCFREALRLRPLDPEMLNNLGNALRGQGEIREALACYREALRLDPEFADAHVNLAGAHLHRGATGDALESYDRAIRLRPRDAEVHFNRAMTLLSTGDFERGWQEYEWRWECDDVPRRHFHRPRWDGSPLEGRTILLHAEQGLGDTIQFIRYAQPVKHLGGTVIVECPGPLMRLLSSCPGIDDLVPRGSALPDFNVHAPLLSVPGLIGTSLATIPARIPYLFPDPGLVESWRRKLDAIEAFKIGIVWQGSLDYRADRQRSIPLDRFATLAKCPGVRLFSLQKGHGTEQLSGIDGHFPVTDLGSELDTTTGAFMDTAAAMMSLDLVISADTAVAHLAGAIGVPAWLALSNPADWRWLLNRDDSPWYPTLRLFRQARPGDWEGVFRRMASELEEQLATAPRRPASIAIEISPGELLDKITILEIKCRHHADPEKLCKLRAELSALNEARDRMIGRPEGLVAPTAELATVNETIWHIEDEIRGCERDGAFGTRFVELARSVYRNNDRRSAIKQEINDITRSKYAEVKIYDFNN